MRGSCCSGGWKLGSDRPWCRASLGFPRRNGDSVMRNRIDIDYSHSRAIVQEIGERLRASLKADRALPASLRMQIDRLRQLEGQSQPNVAKSTPRLWTRRPWVMRNVRCEQMFFRFAPELGPCSKPLACRKRARSRPRTSVCGRGRYRPYSTLTLAARITLPHFSVSSAMSLPKSAGEP